MPQLNFSQALTANQQGFNPLTGWQYEFVPMAYQAGAAVMLLIRATTAGTRLTLFSGAQTIQQRSIVQSGGTAGVTPSELNTPAIRWVAQPGDRLIPTIDETLGGTPTVDGVIVIEPL